MTTEPRLQQIRERISQQRYEGSPHASYDLACLLSLLEERDKRIEELAPKAEAWDSAILLLQLRAAGGTTEEVRDGARASLDLIEFLPEELAKTEHRPVQHEGDKVMWCDMCGCDWPCPDGRAQLLKVVEDDQALIAIGESDR